MNRFSTVERIMPPKTTVPSEFRAALPAPVANTSGITPKQNAIDVMTIGRSRVSAAWRAASRREAPSARNWFANSTIKMAF